MTTKILIIHTGGTIGMAADAQTGTLTPLHLPLITEYIPEMQRLKYDISVHVFTPTLDSANMTPDTWLELAGIIYSNYEEYNGFVILHGSDTMAFTASFLSFCLENLGKPVVLTGSQLPIGEIRTDAKSNLLTALEIVASRRPDAQPLVPEVCIYFDYKLFRGNRATKVDADRFLAFCSANYPPLAEVGVNIKFHENVILKRSYHPFQIHPVFDSSIITLKLFPGIQWHAVYSMLNISGLKGVILETFGAGNASLDSMFLNFLRETIEKGIIILNVSQCLGGTVDQGRYQTSKNLATIGVLSGFDMTYEAALTKLMFVLAQDKGLEEKKTLLQTSLRGELSS